MQVKQITPETLPAVRPKLIRFLNLHGDKRITRQGIRWLERLQAEKLNQKGDVILVAVEQKKLTGLLAISDYGRKESIVVVHRQHRQKKTGINLISEILKRVDKCYGRVALDNVPSLKMCFAMGMVGFKIIEGPTGKPTLWLGLGNWKKEDVE
ncbi:GNAT family N-acetyltransferase [Ammoniphilus oxalaticus]|uniref:GNAT family N-acetyltransferase n=1 Tax=Ammoniphilus oxalaticus TaxID=66863 RepID=A0A419SIB9_9BACL|nr:GNAT family N-acetyltransferase [Ammoniphilus oxalaticus]RKD23761.1 GNAT family N-acetyltransferase [Ammoniphilus oxalaticus]